MLARNYSFAPQRHVTETQPWQLECNNLTANMFFLSTEIDDLDLAKDFRNAAAETFDLMDWGHTLFMGLSTDFMTIAWWFAQWVQSTNLDAVVVPRKCREHLRLLEIAFVDAGILMPQAKNSFTHIVLEQIRRVRHVQQMDS